MKGNPADRGQLIASHFLQRLITFSNDVSQDVTFYYDILNA
jgi:hypothetical protein